MNQPSASAAEGRANLARPSLCLVLLTIVVLLASASPAAALMTPILTETNPASPGATTTPRVKGIIEVIDTKVMTLGVGLRGAGPVTRGEGLTNTVKVYASSNCTGPVLGEGPVSQLKGEGIQVGPLVEDAVTTLYANQTDGLTTSECSVNGLPYRQVSTAPDAPVFEGTDPSSPANQNSPRLYGFADQEATVLIYQGADCAGSVVASGKGTEFEELGIQVSVSDNSETIFSAEADLGGLTSECSEEPVVYREVTPPPEPGGGGSSGGSGSGNGGTPVPAGPPPPAPRLRTVPGGFANDSTPLITGTAPAASTVRIYADPQCGGNPVAKASLAEFLAGVEVRVVDNDVTVFSATSSNGLVSACSEPVAYVEDSLVPHTRITMGPASKTAKRKAIFRFMDATGNLPGTTFQCRVDGRGWKRCTSPLRLRNLKPKRHTVEVKATDAAGNAETKGAKRRFKVVPRP
ncbi:MAG TPA: hypothetical protein VFX45_07570 [Solirubrobacterales bacterium]|nr:hypothetical protein [Solirubrobacterales bacterium]